MEKKEVTWQAWTIAILGLWLIVAAFLNFGSTGNLWNDLIVGLVVLILGFGILKQKPWQAWVAIILGLWMVLVGLFIPSLRIDQSYLWNDLIGGVLIAVAGFGALGKAKEVEKA